MSTFGSARKIVSVPLPWWTSQSTTAMRPDAAHLLGVADRDADVREHAEAHRALRLGVVAGRAHERVGVVDGAVEHGVGRHDRAARGEHGDLVAELAHRAALAGIAAGRAERAHVREVRGRVHAQDLLVGGRPRAQRHELVEHAGDVEQVAEAALRLGVLERALRLHVRLRPASSRSRSRCPRRARRSALPTAIPSPCGRLYPPCARDRSGGVPFAHESARIARRRARGRRRHVSVVAAVGRARARGVARDARLGRAGGRATATGRSASPASSRASRAPRAACRSRTGRTRSRRRWWRAGSARATR